MMFGEEIENEIKEFINKIGNIHYHSDSNYGVEYLNNNFRFLGTKIDGITNSELVFSGKEFFKLLEFLFVNIPEHHYFFDMEKK